MGERNGGVGLEALEGDEGCPMLALFPVGQEYMESTAPNSCQHAVYGCLYTLRHELALAVMSNPTLVKRGISFFALLLPSECGCAVIADERNSGRFRKIAREIDLFVDLTSREMPGSFVELC